MLSYIWAKRGGGGICIVDDVTMMSLSIIFLSVESEVWDVKVGINISSMA